MPYKILVVSALAMLLALSANGQKTKNKGAQSSAPSEQTQPNKPEEKVVNLGDLSKTSASFRTLNPGEAQTRGELQRIDCRGKQVVLTVVNGSRTLHFVASALTRIEFISYVGRVSREISCGARNPPDLVILTYKPASDKKSDGQAVAVEFIPKPAN